MCVCGSERFPPTTPFLRLFPIIDASPTNPASPTHTDTNREHKYQGMSLRDNSWNIEGLRLFKVFGYSSHIFKFNNSLNTFNKFLFLFAVTNLQKVMVHHKVITDCCSLKDISKVRTIITLPAH